MPRNSRLFLVLVFFQIVGLTASCSKRIEKWAVASDSKKLVQISHPTTFAVTPITSQEQDDLLRIESKEPSALVIVRREGGLGILKMRGGTILDNLKESWERQYSLNHPGFHKEKYEELNLNTDKAHVYEFTYLGQDKKSRVRQKFVMIVRGEVAYYLSFQAPDAEFEELRADFDRMIESFTIL